MENQDLINTTLGTCAVIFSYLAYKATKKALSNSSAKQDWEQIEYGINNYHDIKARNESRQILFFKTITFFKSIDVQLCLYILLYIKANNNLINIELYKILNLLKSGIAEISEKESILHLSIKNTFINNLIKEIACKWVLIISFIVVEYIIWGLLKDIGLLNSVINELVILVLSIAPIEILFLWMYDRKRDIDWLNDFIKNNGSTNTTKHSEC